MGAEIGKSISGTTGTGSNSWSVSATLKLPLDLAFRGEAAAAKDYAQAKKVVALSSQSTARLEYRSALKSLERSQSSWEKTRAAAEAAFLALAVTRILYKLGSSSESDLKASETEGLNAVWSLAQARRTVLDAADALSANFALSL
ncbi:hypothetical protein MASR2M78_10260 [Treponema sp.]